MFSNYIKISLRNLWRNKTFSFINLSGLTVGITICLMIFQYIFFEMSYDRFHAQSENIFRVVNLDEIVTVPPALGPTLKESFPEVNEFGRIVREKAILMKDRGKETARIIQESVYYADPSIFKILGFEFTRGGSKRLDQPNQVLLSQTYAQKYFGRDNPVGKVLEIQDQFGKHICTVQGVYKDFPQNSHLHPPIISSLASIANNNISWADINGWGWGSFYTYLLVQPGTQKANLQEKMHQLAKKLAPDDPPSFGLQALSDIHLYSNLDNELEENGQAQLINMLFLVGMLILIIAWINYINLSTARALDRAKEVGIRKVVGAYRLQLVKQFLTEAFLLNILALIFAIILQDFLNPLFYQLVGHEINFVWQESLVLMLGMLGIFALGAFLSGLYPAFVLSAYHPVKVLQGSFKTGRQGVGLRKALVITQFVASVLLISGTFAIYYQLTYMRQKNLGMNIDRLLIIDNKGPKNANAQKLFAEQITQISYVEKVATSANVPGVGYNWGGNGFKPELDKSDKEYPTSNYYVDGNFIDTYEMQLIAGVNGKDFLQQDRKIRGLLMNETAARNFGFEEPAQAVGQRLKEEQFSEGVWEIVGVVKDYHHESLKKKIEPIFFLLDKERHVFSLRIQTGENPQKAIQETIAQSEKLFSKLFPQSPFEYYFLNQVFEQKYQADQRFGNLFSVFSLLAIFIACLGLFGLASFSTLQRTKEIGIRKVLGATSKSIVVLLSREYLWLIIIASLIAWPIAYWGIRVLLENYAYRPPINLFYFLIPTILVGLVALLSVSYQTLKTARANPIKALRDE